MQAIFLRHNFLHDGLSMVGGMGQYSWACSKVNTDFVILINLTWHQAEPSLPCLLLLKRICVRSHGRFAVCTLHHTIRQD